MSQTENLQLHLKLYVDNSSTSIVGKLYGPIYKEFKHTLGYLPENAIYRKQYNPYSDGWVTTVCYNREYCRCSVKKDGTHFPTGLISKACRFFRENGITYDIYDERADFPTREIALGLSDIITPYDYQQQAIEKAVESQRGLIKIATGGGKTLCGAGIIAALGVKPVIFYVTSIELLRQAKYEIERFILSSGKKIEVGMVGGGYKKIKDITVMTVQTAVRALDAQFQKFDNEDEDDNTDITDIKKEIAELIRNAKLYVADECVTGDTIVITRNHGEKRISELNNLIGEEILSYSGYSVVWEKITDFFSKGKKPVIKITLNSGENIKCTKNHPLFTQRGWVLAGEVKLTDQILSLANVDVEQKYQLGEEVQAGTQNTYLGTKSTSVLLKNGKRNSQNSCKMLQNVSVDVDSMLNLIAGLRWSRLSNEEVHNNIGNIFTGTIKDQMRGIWNYLNLNIRLFWEHYLETQALSCQVAEVKTPGCNVIMDWFKKSGSNIKNPYYTNYHQFAGNMKTVDMESIQFRCEHPASHVFQQFMTLLTKTARSLLINSGWTELEQSDWRGGLEMMGVGLNIASNYTQKDFQNRKSSYVQNGSQTIMAKSALIHTEDITYYLSLRKPEETYIHSLKNTSQNVCDTKFVGIKSINEIGTEEVYDITVNKTHCFFANGILAHNCQHWRAETCQIISDNSLSARWRYGMSATPWRDEGDDILIDACFGRMICDINASYLIKRGFLIKPYIAFVPITNLRGHRFGSYPETYKEGIVQNAYRNEWIAGMATKLSEDRNVLILVQQIAHGDIIQSLIPNSVFMHGSSGRVNRKEHLELMKQGKAPITISSVIYDEGIDCRPLDALILAGAGKSATRALQRIGRTLRPYTYPDGRVKKDALIFDLVDHLHYLKQHAAKRRKIYRTEEEFEITDLGI